jgi:hypothetical protein
VVRLTPEEPAHPRIPRQAVAHEKAPVRRREVEGRDWGSAGKLPLPWVIGISAGVLGVVIAALSLLPLINRSNAAGARDRSVLAVDQEQVLKSAEVIEEFLSREEEAERIFGIYTSTAILDDLLPFVRNANTVAPLIRASDRTTFVSKKWEPDGKSKWSVPSVAGKPFGQLQGTLPDFSPFTAYFALENDKLVLDWNATTGYGSATFEELAEGRGDPSGIRGTISPVTYYSAVFPESEFRSFQLISPDRAKAIWCYTRRGEPADAAISRLFLSGDILGPNPEPRKVTLRLEPGPDEALPNQWLVADLLHEEWISP